MNEEEKVPSELHYTPTHLWVEMQEEGTVKIGMTNHAQEQLGEIVFVKLPEEGVCVQAGDEVGVLESIKTTSDIYAGIPGVTQSLYNPLL